MQSINLKNWSYSRYEKDSLIAFISFGMGPENLETSPQENIPYDYYVTVLENEEKEIFQKRFKQLSKACLYLNQNYRDWHYVDQTAKKSGCSTCSAH